MTAQPHARVRFQGAIERRVLWLAEESAREMGVVSLDEAAQLVALYGDLGSPKYEAGALRWLERYLVEDSPTLATFARAVNELAGRLEH